MIKLSKKEIKAGLILIVVFQMATLAWEFVGAMYPIWTGTEIYLKARPVDPRDIFRGSYASLSYDISTIPVEGVTGKPLKVRNGEIIYVTLEKKGKIYEYSGASFDKPSIGIFLRGRIEDNLTFFRDDTQYKIKYGIEAFFAKKEKAMKLENDLRTTGAIAAIKVTASGRAALIDVRKNEEK